MDSFEVMWNTYESINNLIRSFDAKAGVLLASNGLIITFVFSKVISELNLLLASKLLLTIFIVGSTFNITSMCFCISCLKPRLHASNDIISLLFFEDIYKNFKSFHAYKKSVAIKFNNQEDALDQITCQVWNLSKIASEKCTLIKLGNYSFLLSLIFFSALGILISLRS